MEDPLAGPDLLVKPLAGLGAFRRIPSPTPDPGVAVRLPLPRASGGKFNSYAVIAELQFFRPCDPEDILNFTLYKYSCNFSGN
eukprot:6211475-Amphidinium_carterae.1